MSYDLYYFRLKDGFTPKDAERYFRAEEKGKTEKGTPSPFDPTLEDMELTALMAKPYFEAYVPAAKRPDWLKALLAAEAVEEGAEGYDLGEICENFEWMTISIDGVWMEATSYGDGAVGKMSKPVAATVRALAPHNIYIYDPQADAVLQPEKAEEVFAKSAKKAEKAATSVIEELTQGPKKSKKKK